MSGFLIDTNVLSEYNRPGDPDAGVKRWLETTDCQSQHVSVIRLAEIGRSSAILHPDHAGARRSRSLAEK
jgi:predicted nucleic acid-binding protein